MENMFKIIKFPILFNILKFYNNTFPLKLKGALSQ